jgi:hypothetical protein
MSQPHVTMDGPQATEFLTFPSHCPSVMEDCSLGPTGQIACASIAINVKPISPIISISHLMAPSPWLRAFLVPQGSRPGA